jgi:hypothetical protein
LIFSPQGTDPGTDHETRQAGRGACSERIDATQTSAPPGTNDAKRYQGSVNIRFE